jgi:hypothetical protein
MQINLKQEHETLAHDPIKLNRDHGLAFCLSMIFFRKPVPTFRDHALAGRARLTTLPVVATRVTAWAAAARMITILLSVLCLAASSARAQDNVLEKYVGRWDVTVKTLQPQKSDQTYIETYEWMLDRKFVRAKTEGKADGTEDMVVGGYDPMTKKYPFWIFSSTGTFLYLAPGSWDTRSRTLEWKSPPISDVSYLGRCIFSNERTRRCTLIVKAWFGKVLLEQESTAIRRID